MTTTELRRLDACELNDDAWAGRVAKIASGVEQADAADAARLSLDWIRQQRWIGAICRLADDQRKP